MEGPDGISEELGTLAAQALAHPEGQQHETPQVPQQQPEQRGHGGQQRLRSHLPGLLQLSAQHLPSLWSRCWLAGRPRSESPCWGWGREGRTLASIPAFLSQTHQTGKRAVPPGTRGHISSEEKQLANLITVA